MSCERGGELGMAYVWVCLAQVYKHRENKALFSKTLLLA